MLELNDMPLSESSSVFVLSMQTDVSLRNIGLECVFLSNCHSAEGP